ncbi:methyl-accepting chemotaxis protein [Burkholderia sp. WSM2232]|uniref:methyl-accepting chemotaxis protein n=1 Tax=Burkholderia sp. WSM2232 TaxID=944436 RepID=UPI00048602E7|nr:methyl-accepting chemotaxis protein [Burkholderia sp. WSM2232]
MTLNQKLASTIVVLWVGLLFIAAMGIWQTRDAIIAERRMQLSTLIDQATSAITRFHSEAARNLLSDDEAKRQAKAVIASLRYGKDGYITVCDSQAVIVVHPLKPEVAGKSMADMTDTNGKRFYADLIGTARQPQGGFVSYYWPKPGGEAPIEKLAYSKRFSDWDWVLFTGAYMDDIRSTVITCAVRWLVAVAIFGGLATVIMSIALRSARQSIGGQLEAAVETAHRVAEGDLAVDVPVLPGDRTSLMYALSSMRNGLEAAMTDVRNSAENITVGSSEIAAGNADLSRRTEQQAAAVLETASSMNQMTENVRSNAESAKFAAALAGGAATIATRGSTVVNDVILTMDAITTSSNQVNDIISVIDGIAFQTNILALNAAVEAARAGEQGRGFAVVAAEVRSLAQRSATAAKEIKQLIEASSKTVQQGTVHVSAAGTTMSEIERAVRQVNDILREISNASQEQSAGIEQVNAAVNQIDKATQQNAALVEEAAAAAQSLNDQAATLREVIGRFSLSGNKN